MGNVVDMLRDRHERCEDYRAEHGCNPPQFPMYVLSAQYNRRDHSPLWVSSDGDTVVGYSTGWQWGQSHNRAVWRDPVELLETTFLAHPARRFTSSTLLMDGRQVAYVHGSFDGYSAGFALHTTDSDLVARLYGTAIRSLSWQVGYRGRVGYDWAMNRHYYATVGAAERFAGVLRDDYNLVCRVASAPPLPELPVVVR